MIRIRLASFNVNSNKTPGGIDIGELELPPAFIGGFVHAVSAEFGWVAMIQSKVCTADRTLLGQFRRRLGRIPTHGCRLKISRNVQSEARSLAQSRQEERTECATCAV
jgi:hypothetical protein